MSKLVERVVVDLLGTEVRPGMLKAWITRHEPEITKELEVSIIKKEKENAKRVSEDATRKHKLELSNYERAMEHYRQKKSNYESDLKAYQKAFEQASSGNYRYLPRKPVEPNEPEPIKPQELKKITKHGFSYPASRSHEVELDSHQRDLERQKIVTKYTNEFVDTRWQPDFERALREQIIKFNPESILEKFFERHPWLRLELTWNGQELVKGVTYQYLYSLLSKQLISLLTSDGKVASWEALSKNQLTTNNLAWDSSGIEQKWLAEYTEGYPLSAIRRFYCQEHTWSPYKLEKALTNQDWVDYPFSRIDVLRLLTSAYFTSGQENKIQAKRVPRTEYLVSPKVAPLHHTELTKLVPEELNNFELLVVNLNAEDYPAWIIVTKERGQWVAYVDENLAKVAGEILSPPLHPLQINRIDISQHKSLNNLSIKNDICAWHAVLFSRILPACVNNQDLKQYRTNVPLSLLAQEAMESSLAIVETVDYTKKAELTRNFQDRQPFTERDINERKSDEDDHVVGKSQAAAFRGRITTKGILNSFDKGSIKINPDIGVLTIVENSSSKGAEPKQVIESLNLIYHNPSLAYFELPKVPGGISPDAHFNTLFNMDVNLRTIRPIPPSIDPATHNYPLQCAARNRFLDVIDNDYLIQAQKNIKVRRELWNRTGQMLVEFFNTHGAAIDIDFINEIKEFNHHWTSRWCDHKDKSKISEAHWLFAQISQMGIEGLDVLFKHLNENYTKKWSFIYKDLAPALNYTFDASSSLTVQLTDYIAQLTKHIKEFGNENKDNPKGCAPLFNSFSLIIPSKFNHSEVMAVLQLVDALQIRKKNYENELGELILHNINFYQSELGNLLKQWKLKASNDGCLILPRIPALDRLLLEEPEQLKLKALYQEVQNLVKDNQRKIQLAKVEKNTQSIYQLAADTAALSPSERPVNYIKLAQEPQSWDDEQDVKYPLSPQGLGVQQQLQQQVEQQIEFEAKQEVQVEQEYEYEQAQQVVMYGSSEEGLITRNNIEYHEKAKEYWQKIAPDIKELSGWQEGWTLRDLFSLWVGSHNDASNVIEKIEPEALYKIMQNASKFRLNLVKENVPPGFFLQYSPKSQGLILCFSSKREKEDLLHREQLAAEEKKDPTTRDRRNPFTVELYKPQEAKVFRGDFRQFGPISKTIVRNPVEAYSHQQTLWTFLATEEQDKARVESITRKFSTSSDKTAIAVEQRYTVDNQTIVTPGNYEVCLELLTRWAHTNQRWGRLEVASSELINALFNPRQPTVLTPVNLKAFGQLFNEADINHGERIPKNATERWLFIGNQIYTNFGPDNFAIWKSRLLDRSENWLELLEEREVEAITESIKLLQDNPIAQQIWWKLVDAHGKAMGHMRYSDLWNGYKVVLNYIKKYEDLELNLQSIERYLAAAKNFNGQVFLERFYNVLKNASKKTQIRGHILKNIIDNVDKIDWRHNGFYYASRYEGNVEWHEALKFTELTPTFVSDKLSYKASWDAEEQVSDFSTHALRFAMQRMQLSQEDFEQLRTLFSDVNFQDSPQVGRLIIASFLLGAEKIDALSPQQVEIHVTELSKINPAFIDWLNKNFKLEANIDYKLSLRLSDIATFARVVAELDLQDRLNELSLEGGANFINACGRALQCYKQFFEGKEEETLNNLLAFATQKDRFSHPLITDYPWLIKEIKAGGYNYEAWQENLDPLRHVNKLIRDGQAPISFKQVNTFKEQLHSINFSTSKNLPDRHNLEEAFTQIGYRDLGKIKDSAEDYRSGLVTALKHRECNITNLAGKRFRKLNPEEQQAIKRSMAKKLKGVFTEQNLKLLDKLVDNCLSIPFDSDNTILINRFVNILAGIDNKNHYNELAPVLSLLLSKSKMPNGSYRQYSVPQLMQWLEGIQAAPAETKAQHYGMDLLSEVLDDVLKQDKNNLLNENLDYLQVNGNTSLLQQISAISKTSLSNQYKPALVKMAIECDKRRDLTFVEEARKILDSFDKNKVSSPWLAALCDLLISTSKQPETAIAKGVKLCKYASHQLDQTNYPGIKDSEALKKVWQEGQIKQINLLLKKGTLELGDLAVSIGVLKELNESKEPKIAYIRAIFMHNVNDWNKENPTLAELLEVLKAWPPEEVHKLAVYYSSEPNPSLESLKVIINQVAHKNSAEAVIHHFESVSQALNKDGSQKRQYSLTEKDRDSINRVLKGFKRKGENFIPDSERKKLLNLFEYANSYSEAVQLAEMNIGKLTSLLHQVVAQSKDIRLPEFERHQASACVLACMREILLRKSGKWANHTQMLDLLYAALHNDDSLIHQVRTGQGKSIITIMRAAYLALNGYVVDVFSAKDSLSQRDHEEFASVLDGMGIPHSYIPASGPADLYKTKNSDVPGVGAVNYATMGNFSLFQSNHMWVGKNKIELNVKNRVAFIDEADYVSTDEQTQFNHPDNDDNDTVYNLDEWVYRIAYKYYKELMKEGLETTKEGALIISRNKHLKTLCERIQADAKYSPRESRFLQKYITPALTGSKEALKKRDQQLKLLLTAAHTAAGLTEGSRYCIRPTLKVVANGMVLRTRFAKVMIDNQVKDVSTYSDLVQQLLHVHLNDIAVEKGEMPNLFVEPDSQIALSQDASYILKKYYHKLEGCTGTAGNKVDLKEYETKYGIKHVIKLPTHEEVKTKFLEPIYSEDENQQANEIARKIIENIQMDDPQPILITCVDDIAVKRINEKVKLALQKLGHGDLVSNITCDTNDKGKAEAEIVPGSGRSGAITISSRLGRGTDIKPKSKYGLMVLRTYPTIPRVAKQEQGRQGRNGAPGTCQDIINYKQIEREYKLYQGMDERRLDYIYQEQSLHLEEKLKKHVSNGSEKWNWVEKDREKREKYLTTRTVMQFKQELLRRNEKYIRQKEYLIAVLSGEIMDVLHDHIDNRSSFLDAAKLKEDWLECRKFIEADWNNRLAGKEKDTDEIYQQFFDKASKHWEILCSRYRQLDITALVPLVRDVRQVDDQISEIIRQGEFWQSKLNNLDWKPVPKDIEELKRFTKHWKKLMLINHPDKNGSKPTEERELAARNTQKISTFSKVIDDCNARLKGDSGPSVKEELPELPPINLNEVSGAIVLVKNPVNIEDKTTRAEINAVIEFYQQWLTGTRLYYFGDPRISDELIEKIYGGQQQGLNNLFKTIYDNSFSHHAFNIDTINYRRDFFNNLKQLIHNGSATYFISCQELANTILLLTNSNRANYANNLACLQQFFKQDWFKGKNPNEFRPTDISKHDRLLRLTMNIVSKRFVNTEVAQETFDFINNLGKAIHDKHWDAFDDELANEIESILACTPDVVELLTKSVNENDIAYFVKLISENKGAANWGSKKKTLIDYLTHKRDELNKLKGVVNPLFRITLSPNAGAIYLPNHPKILPKINNAQVQYECWNFLAERAGHNKEECKKLIDSLSSQEGEAFIDKVLKPIFALPQALPLKMISDGIEFTPGKEFHANFGPNIQRLAKVGKKFNKFLLKRGLISSTAAHSVVVGRELEFDEWVGKLNQLSLKKSEQFFVLAKKESVASIPLNILSKIADKFVDGSITNLQQVLTGVANFYTETQLVKFIISEEKWLMVEQSIRENDLLKLAELTEGIVKFNQATQIMVFLDQETKKAIVRGAINNLPKFARVTEHLSEFDKATKNMTLLNTETWVFMVGKLIKGNYSQFDKLVESLANLQKKTSNLEKLNNMFGPRGIKTIKEEFIKLCTNTEAVETKLLNYINNLTLLIECIEKTQENLGIQSTSEEILEAQRTAFMALYNKFIKEKTIPDSAQLYAAADVVKKAVQLLANKNYDRLFFTFKTEKSADRKERETLMQYLHHGIVNLGIKFAEKCFDLYGSLSVNLLNDLHKPTKFGNDGERKTGIGNLRTCYHKIIAFTRELVNVSKLPSGMVNPVTDKTTGGMAAEKGMYRTYFAQQEKNYNSFWSKNKIREEQAKTLFSTLNNLVRADTEHNINMQISNFTTNKGECYHKILQAIWIGQQSILVSDTANVKHNKKGYSRLYDITMQMFAKVAHDCLVSKDVNLEEKSKVHSLLHEQLGKIFDTLWGRLPDESHLKTKLQRVYGRKAEEKNNFLAPGSTELSWLRDLLKDSENYKNTPKNLRYLLDNLTCLVNVTGTEVEAREYYWLYPK